MHPIMLSATSMQLARQEHKPHRPYLRMTLHRKTNITCVKQSIGRHVVGWGRAANSLS